MFRPQVSSRTAELYLNKQNHLLVSDLTEMRTTKMTQWTKTILRRKGGKGTVTNAEDENDVKATKLMEFIEVTDPKEAVKGLQIRFMYDHGEGTVYWLEGTVEQRLTKPSKPKRLKFTETFFRIGKLRVIETWRDDPKPLPATVATNLTRHVGWTKATTKELPVGEDSTIEIGPNDIPTSKREEEVD